MKNICLIAIIFALAAWTIAADQDCAAGYTSFKTTLIPDQNVPANIQQYLQIPWYPLICEKSDIAFNYVNNQNQCGGQSQYSGASIGFTFDFGFTLATASSVQFRFGLDFGKGGIVLIDGNVVAQTFNDQWWNLNWSSAGQFLLNPPTQNLAAGCHHVTVIGKEACCDGAQVLQINVGNGGWQTIDPTVLGSFNDQIIQTGQCDWVSLSASVPQHWCHCNCWVVGASQNPINLSQLAPACALSDADVKFYTSCKWVCPSGVNTFGVLSVSQWVADCQ